MAEFEISYQPVLEKSYYLFSVKKKTKKQIDG